LFFANPVIASFAAADAATECSQGWSESSSATPGPGRTVKWSPVRATDTTHTVLLSPFQGLGVW